MKRFLVIILTFSFFMVAWFGLGNIVLDWHADGHSCSLVTLSGQGCPTGNDLSSFLNLFFPATIASLADILLVAVVLWIYIANKPPFYRQRFRRWLALLERRADRTRSLTA